MNTDIYMTVGELRKLCVRLEAQGMGHYGVGCNQIFCLARKQDTPYIDKEEETIDLGLYVDRQD